MRPAIVDPRSGGGTRPAPGTSACCICLHWPRLACERAWTPWRLQHLQPARLADHPINGAFATPVCRRRRDSRPSRRSIAFASWCRKSPSHPTSGPSSTFRDSSNHSYLRTGYIAQNSTIRDGHACLPPPPPLSRVRPKRSCRLRGTNQPLPAERPPSQRFSVVHEARFAQRSSGPLALQAMVERYLKREE